MSLHKIKDILCRDSVLKKVIENHDILNLESSGNVFNELVKNIIYQQISFKGANTIYGRLIDLLGHEEYKPRDILDIDFETLRSVGLTRPKTQYIINICQHFISQDLLYCDWDKYTDDDIIDKLTQIKGVGTWTVEMILIFELHRPDVFPIKDLAIQQAMKALYEIKSDKKALIVDMYKIAESWKPYRSYATLYLWSWSRDQKTRK
jgi:DNA-3-methyladenine glycosylase II